MGLVVDWDGETHLIHLAGTDLFKEAGIDVGRSISGGMINDIEYRVDVTSLYNSVERADPAGALVLKAGELHLYCSRLGDRIHYDPHPVPLGKGYLVGAAEEACGFTRWSIAIREGDESRIVKSFEAAPEL